MKKSMKPLRFVLPLLFLALFLGSDCQHKQPVQQAAPVPEVAVANPVKQDVQFYFETVGKAKAFESTDIPARVSGQLQEIYYKPGQIVFEGDPLFLIEPYRYEANVQSATAKLESAKANRDIKQITLDRNTELLKDNAVSKQTVDENAADVKVAEADILDAEANLANAKLDLSYTKILAPISGKTKQNLIDAGNIVGTSAENTILTSIQNMDPILIYFQVASSQINELHEIQAELNDELKDVLNRLKKSNDARLKRKAELKQTLDSENSEPEKTESEQKSTAILPGADLREIVEQRQKLEDKSFPFSIALDDGPGAKRDYKFNGVLDMTSNEINAQSGTIICRGQVPNESYIIYPGQSVHVRIPTVLVKDAVLVREDAIGRDLNNRYVLVVDEKNVVSRKNIELGPVQKDGLRVVMKGLSHDDKYIVQGIQKARVNKPVKIKE